MRISGTDTADLRPSKRLCGKEELRLLILEVLELPMMPVLISRILKVTGAESGPGDMARVISTDRALADNILKVANSTFFGLSQEVSAVSRAIKVVGYEAVRSIALSSLLTETVGQNDGICRFDRNRFWTHSLACAYLSKKIAAMTHRAELETTFVCGLLHDIGKALIAIYFPSSYNRVLRRLAAVPLTSVQSEDEVLGFTHAEVGMWLAQRWQFPKAVVFTIANHHGMIARDERYNSLAAILHLADHLCLKEQLSLEERAFVEPLESAILDQLKLGRLDLIELKDALAEGKGAISSLFSAEISETKE